jgi:hypothetical protein
MGNLALSENKIPMMTDKDINNVYQLQKEEIKKEQVPIVTDHVIHGGIYSRTIMIPAGVVLTGALVRVPTTLTISGRAMVYMNGGAKEISGYRVLAASANRKQAFVAINDTYLTMAFKTNAKTVEAAENEFTHESSLLMSRVDGATNNMLITGE